MLWNLSEQVQTYEYIYTISLFQSYKQDLIIDQRDQFFCKSVPQRKRLRTTTDTSLIVAKRFTDIEILAYVENF